MIARLLAVACLLFLLESGASAKTQGVALGQFGNMGVEVSKGPTPRMQGTVALAYPGKSWRLVLELPGFEIDPVVLLPGGKGVRLSGANPETDILITVFLEESKPGWTAVDHREDVWKKVQKASMKRRDVRRSERGEMAVLESVTPEFMGIDVDQKNVNAFLVRDGIWIDVHLSKMKFRKKEQKLFDAILATVRFEE